MQIPTIKQFNRWTLQKKIAWVKAEAVGEDAAPGLGGFLMYPDQDMGIRYITDQTGRVTGATAMKHRDAIAAMIRGAELIKSIYPTQMN
ncbi:hypothetical protein [Flavihumibacter sp. CACIAM 22H1]|uniref:hypothetical protein n=1 Tax=Flavihumibacter sp. CACIAM 22H1 TaxID=1812911 RepID=UPI0007A8BEA1|nr:hypothetical protein [Flavihumibacter sp. CACIAM 22H1]KYP16631.1 MAG: hypothetical protein A1D16_09470 [Flavihumibacter sp. CACIAM 22H1]